MSVLSDALVHAYDEKFNSVQPSAVAIQLGVMGGVSLLALIVFSALRWNATAYQPKLNYYDRKLPPTIGDGLFAWMTPLMKWNEESYSDVIGLDASCYLRFTRMCRNFLFAIALLGAASLIPINVIFSVNNVDGPRRNILSMMTIQNTREVWLWSHVGATYAFTLVGMWFVHRNYAVMVKLRWRWFREECRDTLSARSIMVTCVHKRYQSDFGLAHLLRSLKIPYPTTAVHIGRRFGALPSLINVHSSAVKALERVLTNYLKNPNRLPKRPTLRINGTRVDAIDHLTAKIRLLEKKIETTRNNIGEKVAENFGFASFARTAYAQIVARVLEKRGSHRGSHFSLAPPPHDIIWENIALEDFARFRSKIVGGIISLTLMLIYTVPIFIVSLLSNLAAIAPYFAFLNDWSNYSPFLFAAFSGVVPPVLTLLLQSFLPVCFRWIVSYEGAITYTQRDRIVLSRYSAFIFISQFVLFSIFGWALEIALKELAAEGRIALSGSDIWRYIRFLPTSLHDTYMRQSTYWLTISLTKIATTFIDLTRVLPLSVVWVRAMLGRTPREIREATKPRTFDYPVYYANNLLILAVGIAYSPIAPLVTLGCAAAFLASTCVDKYLLMYVNTTKRESGGRSWRVVVNRFLFSLLAMQLLMLMAIAVQMGWIYSFSLIPSMIMVVIFKVTLVRKFDNAFRWYIPDAEEIEESEFHQADATADRLERRFGHPSLHQPLLTPMLHKTVEHLLPLVYKGRIEESTTFRPLVVVSDTRKET